MKLIRLISLVLLFASSSVASESFKAAIESIARESPTKTASIGVCLIPLEEGPESAFGFDIDRALIPASTQKVVATATANEVLGSDFRFETMLQASGSLSDDGVLDGDIIIVGGGDPTLAEWGFSEIFTTWTKAVKEAGIRSVTGRVVGDGTLFGTQMVPATWQANDFGNYFGSGISGLSALRNLVTYRFSTPRVGAAAPLQSSTPQLPHITLRNDMRVGAAGSGDQGYVYGFPFADTYVLRGTVPAGSGSFSIKGALPDPPFFVAMSFQDHLKKAGIDIAGEPTTIRRIAYDGNPVDGSARRMLHRHQSADLRNLMILTNQKSNNLRAEAMHRMIGVKLADDGSNAGAAEATARYWTDRGLDTAGMVIADGCGLSRSNALTARQLATILHKAARGENFSAFHDSLPVSGRSGTLASMGRGSRAEGRVRAKSGTISRVRNYAGYVNSRSGKRYAFALFVNHYNGSLSQVKGQIVRMWEKMVDL